jgi:hypothetical protein
MLFWFGPTVIPPIASKRKKKEWTYPTAEDLEGNKREIRQLKKELM